MDSYAFQTVLNEIPTTYNPFNEKNRIGDNFYVLVEIQCNHDIEVLEEMFFEKITE
jgi:hypothetical protein